MTMTIRSVVAVMQASGGVEPALLESWAADQTARAEKVTLCRDYVAGDHPQDLTDTMRRMLRLKAASPIQEFCLNYMDNVVQTLADRLRVVGLDAADEKARAWAADHWVNGDLNGLQTDVHEAALIDGDTFVMAYFDAQTGQVRWCHEPGFDGADGMLVYYASATAREPVAAIKVWTAGDETRVNVYRADRVERWVGREAAMRPYDTPEQAALSAWTMRDGAPIGVPVVHFRHRARRWGMYGMSEIETAIPIQNALNRTLYSMVMAAEMTAFQIRYAVGWQPPLDLAPGMWMSISPERPLAPDEKIDIGTLGQGELMPYLDMARYLSGEIGRITRTPAPEWSADSASGESLKQREVGLIGKARRFQVKAGDAWSRCLALGARVESAFGTRRAPIHARFSVQWASPEARDDGQRLRDALSVADRVGKAEFLRLIAPVFGYDDGKIAALTQETPSS
jgi:hypothetical protein